MEEGRGRKRRRTQLASEENPQIIVAGTSSAATAPQSEPTTPEANATSDTNSDTSEIMDLPSIPETSDVTTAILPTCVRPSTSANSKRDITPEELHEMLGRTENTILIVDSRDLTEFLKGKIKFSKCFNIPIKSTLVEVPNGLNSKSSVVQFLQEHCPKLLRYLYGAGYYDSIVIYDDKSTFETIPQSIKAIMEALIKWNEGKKTQISILEGGMNAWTNKYPNAVSCDENWMPVPEYNVKVQAQVSQEELALRNFHITPVFTKDMTPSAEHLELHLKNLEMAVSTTKSVISLRGNWKSLLAVKLTLTDESESEVNQGFESQVPADVKCPVCLEIFDAEIFQCGNGHSVCGRCCRLLNVCPKCRMSYKKGAAKIRNRSLESLMASTLKVDCKSCGRNLYYKLVQNHVKTCPGKKLAEIELIVKELATLEEQIKMMSEKLELMNQYILDTENFWNTWLDRGYESSKRSSNFDFESVLIEMLAKKITLGTLNATLLSAVFLKSENKLKISNPTDTSSVF